MFHLLFDEKLGSVRDLFYDADRAILLLQYSAMCLWPNKVTTNRPDHLNLKETSEQILVDKLKMDHMVRAEEKEQSLQAAK